MILLLLNENGELIAGTIYADNAKEKENEAFPAEFHIYSALLVKPLGDMKKDILELAALVSES